MMPALTLENITPAIQFEARSHIPSDEFRFKPYLSVTVLTQRAALSTHYLSFKQIFFGGGGWVRFGGMVCTLPEVSTCPL